MPVLNWIGKEAVVNHDKQVPFKLLKKIKSASKGEKSENLIIHGDNLEALKALMPYYQGKVKCIYIDPPYNTGNEKWVYNDKVNSPKIKQWLGKVVGKDSEDLTRHDKWLCMIYPRLKLLHELLSDDGLIFISIDDNEYQNLKFVCDEIFERKNFITNFTWKTEGNFDNQAKIKINHEYILCYAKAFENFKHPKVVDPNISEDSKIYKNEIRNTIVKNGPKNPISEIVLPKGFPADFKEGIIKARTDVWPMISSDIKVKDYKTLNSTILKSGWSSKQIFESFIKNGNRAVVDTKKQVTTFILTKNGAIENIKQREDASHVVSSLTNFGSTQSMSNELKKFGIKFDYPKPIKLLSYLISLVPGDDFIVLDSFAGSGSTAEAVLDRNQDGGKRKFILIEMEESVIKKITTKRVRHCIEKYMSEEAFEYCELSKPLFDAEGKIDESCDFNQLASYIYFTETQTNTDSKVINGNYIGERNTSDYYLIYKGKDRNDLNESFLKKLKKDSRTKVIYADRCLLDEAVMKEYGIVFKQIPYEVKIY